MSLENNELVLQDALANAGTYTHKETYDEEKAGLQQAIRDFVADDAHNVLAYILEHYYDKRMQEIDTEYLFSVGAAFAKHQEEVKRAVNKYTTSFSYEKMDVIDQALFTLGYVERKTLETPKEILLNELVELAKRYADDGSSKLINGIMHRIITGE